VTSACPARRLPPGLHRGLLLGLLLLLALVSWAVSASDCPNRGMAARGPALSGQTAVATVGLAAARPSWSQAASVTTATVAACSVRQASTPAGPPPGPSADAPEFAPLPVFDLVADRRPARAWPPAAGAGHPNAPPQRLLRPPALG
jgi:hypothetical protein